MTVVVRMPPNEMRRGPAPSQPSADDHQAATTQPDGIILTPCYIERRAELELRCAWLTAHAYLLFEAEEAGTPIGSDGAGYLAAQLLDLRCLLQLADWQGVVRVITIDFDHFRARILQDCLTEATAAYWLRRAATFDAVNGLPALPLDADPNTVASAPEAMQVALACRRHAWLLEQETSTPISDEVWAALGEVA